MSLNRISAAEAASLIKHGYNIGLSGFTPAGTAKAVTAELAKIAEAEHAKGNPFQVGIFTGASTGESCDGVLSRAKAIRYRAPYTTNADFRKAVNNGEIAYNDIHLSQMAQEVRYGFMGKVNVAIIEACEVTPDGKIYLTAAGGIAPTICRLADQIIVELNSAHSKSGMGMHDVYEPLDPPYRREIPIYKPSDRIGLPYIQVDPKKIVGLTNDAEVLNNFRKERMIAYGLSPETIYSDMDRIWAELEYAYDLYNKLGCIVINVSKRSIEETAAIIMSSIEISDTTIIP